MKGTILHIQRFSTGDGPGIRSTVFFKGCPLSCRWCHNPESQSARPQLAYYRQKCLHCGACAAVCPQAVITPNASGSANMICYSHCTCCRQCVSVCPGGALEIFGQEMDTEQIVAIVERDRAFYATRGGVTLSGGEPCVQSDFVASILRALHMRGISTALDTCGACAWEKLEPLMRDTDLVLFDLKHMDTERHRQMTGLGNEQILDNFRRLQTLSVKTRVRIPVIPGYNDSQENWDRVIAFLRPYPNVPVELLPYHTLGKGKYEAIGDKWEMPDCAQPPETAMQAHRAYLTRGGVHCIQGNGKELDVNM